MNPRHYVSIAFYALVVRLLRALPPATAQRCFGALARFAFGLAGSARDFTLVNLRIAYPDLSERERRELGRRSFEHLAWNVIDLAHAETWSDDDLLAHVEFSGLEHVQAAMAQGKGVLGLTLHMGNFELAVRGVPLCGLPASAVLKPRRNPLLDERIAAMRSRTGTELIPFKNAAPSILRALRRGRIVGLLIDQYSKPSHGVMVPLFGKRCSTSSGLATLALRSGAPVVPFYIVRDGPDHHQATFLPPLQTPRTGDLKQDIESATAAYNAVIESIIRKYPEQWLWGHRRFRHSPDLPPRPYG